MCSAPPGSLVTGLSPLARGNLHAGLPGQLGSGPIPARAGQPCGRWCSAIRRRAYPRSRGATGLNEYERGGKWGLSPLARGNLSSRWWRLLAAGPIPARAGQPNICIFWCCFWWAYPRSRGATLTRATRIMWQWGLSPLARGNHGAGSVGGNGEGPIPARAGQPLSLRTRCRGHRAYPRSRGATRSANHFDKRFAGLSPLARGNP